MERIQPMLAVSTLAFSLQPPGSLPDAGWILLSLAALCAAANQIDAFLDRRKTKPGQPPNEQLQLSHNELTRRVQQLEQALASLDHELKDDRRNNEAHFSARSAKIFDKIENVRLEMKADLEEYTRRFDAKFEALPERVINLLRHTGAIGGS